MTKIINVPQGHSARFTRETERYDISGLYTCEITTCNIIAGIGQDKLVLIHVDWNIICSRTALEQVKKDIEWLGMPGEVVVISRKRGKYDGVYGGKQVNKALLAYLAQTMPSIEILEKELREDDNGIYLSCELQQGSYIHNKIKTFHNQKAPEGLIYHPHEQQFLCTRQIGYIIGAREMHETGNIKNRQLCIFDGMAWELLDKANLSVDSSYPATIQEIQSFNKTDTYADILKKLFKIAMPMIESGFSIQQVSIQAAGIAVYLEAYINDYDYALLFKRDLKQIINSHLDAPISSTDKHFKININLILNKENDVFDEVAQLVDKYEKQASRTKFKDAFMHEYEIFSKYYLERKKYSDLMEIQRQMRKDAVQLSRNAAENYKTKNYEAVTILSLEALKLCIYSCIKGDPYLTTTCLNYAQILTHTEKHQEAYFLFKLCLRLQEAYPRLDNPALQTQNIKAVQLQLSECEKKMTTQLAMKQQARIKYGENKAISKIIYVPQGYSARLTRKQMLRHDISGLFTDGFSSCNIVAVISIDKLILMHIDANILGAVKMLAQMHREIEWIDGAREIIVAFRNVDNGGGRNINKDLLAYFALDMPLVRIVEKEIDNDTHGICLSFGTQKPSDLHSNIKKFPFLVRPEGLIHHPQERQFLSVQKMEQVIGKEEQLLSGLTKNKQFCLFNSGWEVLGEAELKVDITHPITRTEMTLFSKDDVYIEIIQLLRMFMNKSVVPYKGDTDTAAIFMAPYFEDYLNNYNYALLFKRNLKYMVNIERYKPQSNADRNFKQAIIRLSTSPGDIFDELKKMVDEYKAQALESEFKEMMLDGYETFTRHYKDRKYYDDLKQTYIQMLEKATSYNKEGLYNYKEKNYKLAASSFLEAIKLYTYGCVKSFPNLASTYYNYGQSLGKAGDYQGAVIFIKVALDLRENYTQPNPPQQELEKTRAALNTYQEKLEEQSSSVRVLVKTLDINQDNKSPCDSTNNSVNEDRKLYSQGMQLYRAGNYAAALNCFQQELINQKKTEIILPNIETAILNFNIGSVYLKMQNPMSALVYLQTAFDVRCQLLGADDEATVKTKTRLEECQAAINLISQTLIFSVPKPEAVAPDLTLNSEPVINRFRINKE